MKKVLVTLFLTSLLGSAVAAGPASAAPTGGPTVKCDLIHGCPHNN